MIESLLSLFTNKPVLHLATPVDEVGSMCFKNVVVGLGPFNMLKPNIAHTFTMEPMRDFMRSNAGLGPFKPFRQHQVLLLEKPMSRGRGRHLRNHAEMLADLRKTFPEISFVSFEPEGMPLKTQLEYAANSTVILSPPGGLSYLIWFAAPGASAVIPDVWGGTQFPADVEGHPHSGKSMRYQRDFLIWNRFHFLSKVPYPVCKASEMLSGQIGSERADEMDIQIVLPRMRYTLAMALQFAERKAPHVPASTSAKQVVKTWGRRLSNICTVDWEAPPSKAA